MTLILQQVQIVGIVAAAQSLVILTAGIDLSVGAIMVFSSVIMGQFTFRYGIPVPVAVFVRPGRWNRSERSMAGLSVALSCPRSLSRSGMWQIVLATNFLYSANETIRSQDIEANAPFLQFFGTKFSIGGATFTVGVIFMLVLIFVLGLRAETHGLGAACLRGRR